MSSLVTSVRLILLTRANVCRSPYFRAFAKVEIEYQPTTTAFYVNTTDLLVEMQNAVGSILGVIPGISVASNKFTARVAGAYAVRTELNRILVLKGKEAEFFSTYQVTLLPLDKKMKRRLPFKISSSASFDLNFALGELANFGARDSTT